MPNADNIDSPHDPILHVQQQFVRHQAIVLAYVLSLEASVADAHDIVQETFLAVTTNAAHFTPGTNFPAWACTMARYQTLSFQKRRARHAGTLDADVIELLAAEDTVDHDHFATEVAQLQDCLNRLAPRARDLIWSRYHQQQQPGHIAQDMGWSANAVRVALSRARSSLLACMAKQALARGDHD